MLCRTQVPVRFVLKRRETAMKDAVGSPESALWPRDPYKGLNRFCTADAPLFSQRDREIDEVTALLSNFDTRVLLFHGGTGTGKSSFLRAGLGPRFQSASA